jgi:hypothetical protein
MERTQQGNSTTLFVDQMVTKDLEIEIAKKECERIEKGQPREVGRYVCGLQKNVLLNDQNCSFFVDAAIAELNEDECEHMEISKSLEEPGENCCPLYGFGNKRNFSPDGQIMDLTNFAETLRKEEREFAKFGRTTGYTDGSFFEDSEQELFLHRMFAAPPLDSRYGSPLIHVQHLYCKDCINYVSADEGTSSAEISEENFKEYKCSKCGKLLNAEDTRDVKGEDKNDVKDHATDGVKDKRNDDVKDESAHDDKSAMKDRVWSSWMHNCFAIRKNAELFTKPGDSGAIVFDKKGPACGLVFGSFTEPSKNIKYSLASPLSVALKALEEEFGIKGLKLW